MMQEPEVVSMRSFGRLEFLAFSLVLAVGGCAGKKIIHTDAPPDEKKPPGGMECGGELGESPSLRRLTQTEYNNTVRDLLGEESNPANNFAPDFEVYGFRNNSTMLSITQLLASQLWTASE